MRKNEKIFLDLVDKGVFKVYKNGKIYKCKKSYKGWNGEYKDCKPRLMKAKTSGYIQIVFRYKGKNIHILAHRAIWIYFNGEIPEDLEINHKNGVKDDNRLSKLELTTASKNILHAHKIGLMKQLGENNSSHKLTEKKVLKVKRLLKQGLMQTEIAKILNVNKDNVSNIKYKKSWSWLT